MQPSCTEPNPGVFDSSLFTLRSSLFGNPQQTYCCKHRADAKDDEDEHRDGVLDARRSGVGINNLANPNRHEE